MAASGSNEKRAPVHELSANAVRDVSEVVRCKSLPAQWEKFPLRTQQEMLAGRNALADARIGLWADEGEDWLRNQFKGKNVGFNTSWNSDDRSITLRVYRPHSDARKADQFLFEVTEKAESFVSNLTVTKIIMVL